MATTFNNSVIVAGGYDSDKKKLDIVEKYDTGKKQWVLLEAMARPMAGGYLFKI